MLGRVRRSTISSMEQLELERPSSKLIKTDSLSIYETTLLKLREGSRRDTSFPAESSVDGNGNICCLTSGGSPREDASITDTDSSSEYLEDTSNCQPTGSLRETKKTNFSLAYMFSRYRNSQCAGGTNEEDAMVIADDTCSPNSSLSPNNSQLMSNSVQSCNTGTHFIPL